MSIVKRVFLAFLLLVPVATAGAASREQAIQELKARFVKSARIDEAFYAAPKELRGNMPYAYKEDLALLREPEDLLREAIDQVIRNGSRDEMIGGLGFYCFMIYNKREKPNPEYYPIVLDLLVNDDGRSDYFTGVLVNALHWYPARETVLAMAGVAERSTNFKLRETALAGAADMMGMRLEVYANATPEQNEKAISDFVSWIRRNEDRIRFSKKGHFRLAGGEVGEDREGLGEEDRARIRRDPAGVLRLFNQIVGDEDDSSADLTGECAAGLLGPQGAALMAKRAALAKEGKEPTRDMEASLGSYQGSYPVADAGLLAAVYIVAYEKDAKALKMAREMLSQASRGDVRRVAGSEPRSVRRKAEALAGEKTEEEED